MGEPFDGKGGNATEVEYSGFIFRIQCLFDIKKQINEKTKISLHAMMPRSTHYYLMPIPDFIPVLVPYESLPGSDLMFAEITFGMRYSRRKYILKIRWSKEVSLISPVISTKGTFRE